MSDDFAKIQTVPIPRKGWNTSIPPFSLSADYATQLENFIAEPAGPKTRQGTSLFATDPTNQLIQGVVGYNPPISLATDQLFSVASNGIRDITSGVPGPLLLTKVASGRVSSVQFSTSANTYLYVAHRGDPLSLYNGAAWVAVTNVSVPAITGVSTVNITTVEVYRKRLFFLDNSLTFYYLPIDSVGGAASQFNLGSITRHGGSLVSMCTWTVDAGDGIDDYMVFMTSNGEIIVYAGSDPATPADWVLKGVYYVGNPIASMDSLKKFGGDVLVLTDAGLFPLSKLLASATLDRTSAVTNAIEPTIIAAARGQPLPAARPVWAMTVVPQHSCVLIHYYDAASATPLGECFCYQIQTGGWSFLRNFPTGHICIFKGEVYSTIGQKYVYKLFTGYTDAALLNPVASTSINTVIKTYYTRFKSLSKNLIQQLRMNAVFLLPHDFYLGIAVDGKNDFLLQLVDIDPTAYWGANAIYGNQWETLAADEGYAFSLCWLGIISGSQIQLFSFDVQMTPSDPNG